MTIHPETIYAVSTGPGRAGIAVIRISGPSAGHILLRMAGSLPHPRLAALRKLRDPESGEVLDQAMVLWLPGPGSFTGEDVAELHIHGGAAVAAGILAVLGDFASTRPAEPGEFTRRAFANGRLDLVEAEGLADLLSARTSRQRQQAMHHLLGEASSVYDDWRQRLLAILARVEAAVDFVEEDGVATQAMRGVDEEIGSLIKAMTGALAGAKAASALRSGIRIVLAGLPNTGKSSLLNALSKRDAAIVSPYAGTTRDVISVAMDIEGFAVELSDTAGLRRNSGDEIEKIGMERTGRELENADIVIWVAAADVADSMVVWPGFFADIRVLNKCDIQVPDEAINLPDAVVLAVSAQTGAGLERLIGEVAQLIRRNYSHATHPVVVRDRQRQAIVNSIRYLNDAHIPGLATELVAESLRAVAVELGRITGRIDVEDLLTAIFAEFCIGK